MTSLGNKFSSTMMNNRRFSELIYFKKITSIPDFTNGRFAYVNFSNIKTIPNAFSTNIVDPSYMNVVSMPNLTYAYAYPHGFNSWSGMKTPYPNTAFYFPKVESMYQIWNNWYSNGRIRWFVIGIEYESVVTIQHTVSLNGVLASSNFIGIFVPDNLVDTYKTAPYWSNAAQKIFGISEFVTRTGELLPKDNE